MASEPKTLQDAVKYFADPANCREYLVKRHWPDGVCCPRCGSKNVLFLEKYNRWHCREKHEAPQFTLKTGTIMEDSPIGLDKWMMATWMIVNCKNGVSSYEIHRATGVTQKTAWFMLQRIRLAMQDDLSGGMLGGEVEVDESFIGGRARNMNKADKARKMQGKRGGSEAGNKTVVMGMLERASEGKQKRVRATVIADRKKATMLPEITAHVSKDANIYADEYAGTWGQNEGLNVQMVNHLQSYVDGNVHTNGLENFWSLLKRCIGGTYVIVEPFHSFRYVDERRSASTIGRTATESR